MRFSRNLKHSYGSILLVIVIIVFILMTTIYSFKTRMIDYDNACHIQNAISIIDGKLPYRDFMLLKTPLYPYIVSLVFTLFGVGLDSVLSLNILIGALTAVVIYALGKKMSSTISGVLASAFYALSYFSILMHVAGKMEPFYNLLLVLSMLSLVILGTNRVSGIMMVSFLSSLALFSVPRAAIPTVGGFMLTLLLISGIKVALLYAGFSLVFFSVMSAPFIIAAPLRFFVDVFLFNVMRGYQPTPGILMSLSWVTENNGLFVLSVGTLGILFSTFAAWGRLPKRFERLPSMLEKRDATLLISLLVSFLAFLGLQGFVYPYMVYAIWPVLSLGAGMTLGYAGNRIQTGFFFHTPRSSQKHLALLILCFLVVGVVAGNISMTVQASDFEGTWSRTERKSLDDAAQFIEGQTKPSDSVLSFIPSLSLLIDRPRVLPDNPSGGNLDLINYFPLRAFYEILDNGTKPFNPLELLKIRSDLTRVQTQLQAQELSGMLSTAKILVLDEQRLTAFIPEYDQTFGAVISEKCEFLRAFGTDGWIRIYSVR